MEKTQNTIEKTIEMFLENISLTRSENTEKTYHNAMNAFKQMLIEKNISPDNPVTDLSEKLFSDYAKYLKAYSSSTESLYINVAKNYFEFLAAEEIINFNLFQTKLLIKNRTRKPGIRLPQFPKHDIDAVIDYAISTIPNLPVMNENEKLINLRDSAFLVTLADTGLRIHEACNLRRGTIDWFSHKAVIIGKGNKEAVIRFSDRSITALKEYLNARANYDGATGSPLAVLPIFARHDKGAGTKVIPMTTKTGRMIVSSRVEECLGKEAVGTITPHSFRHYFVTNVLNKTGNMKIAQEFARHSSITVTQRYTHLSNEDLDKKYDKIFNNED
ncbi:MAG: tyrosine-type recombinase/integrase [Anaerolineaceae bacterium]|nr:tyrosine-type recombinase/integrase [Anaerolineaceae bacterium]